MQPELLELHSAEIMDVGRVPFHFLQLKFHFGLREHLLARGVKVPPIRYPEYMRSGEINIADPDGFHITVAHWGKSEQEAWEKRISAKT
jgi:hypothetical protein